METQTRASPPAVNLPFSELERQMEGRNTADMARVMENHAAKVDTVAYVAQNLSGTHKRELRLAAMVGKAEAKTLAKRARDPPVLPDQMLEALLKKVVQLKREGREKNDRMAELEHRCGELREAMVAGEISSPNQFVQALAETSLVGELGGTPVGGETSGGEKTPGTQIPSRMSVSPGWLPTTKKSFEAYLEKTVLGHVHGQVVDGGLGALCSQDNEEIGESYLPGATDAYNNDREMGSGGRPGYCAGCRA